MDLYRLDNPAEVPELGLDEYLSGDGVCVVEWAEKARDVLPSRHLLVQMTHVSENERRLLLTAQNSRYEELLRHLKQEILA